MEEQGLNVGEDPFSKLLGGPSKKQTVDNNASKTKFFFD